MRKIIPYIVLLVFTSCSSLFTEPLESTRIDNPLKLSTLKSFPNQNPSVALMINNELFAVSLFETGLYLQSIQSEFLSPFYSNEKSNSIAVQNQINSFIGVLNSDLNEFNKLNFYVYKQSNSNLNREYLFSFQNKNLELKAIAVPGQLENLGLAAFKGEETHKLIAFLKTPLGVGFEKFRGGGSSEDSVYIYKDFSSLLPNGFLVERILPISENKVLLAGYNDRNSYLYRNIQLIELEFDQVERNLFITNQREFQTPFYEQISDIKSLNGNYYIAGHTQKLEHHHSMLVMKLNFEFEVQWSETIEYQTTKFGETNNAHDGAYSILPTLAGKVYVIGESSVYGNMCGVLFELDEHLGIVKQSLELNASSSNYVNASLFDNSGNIKVVFTERSLDDQYQLNFQEINRPSSHPIVPAF